MAVGSVISRQTNRQIYEATEGLRALLDGKMRTVEKVANIDTDECSYIMDPTIGEIII